LRVFSLDFFEGIMSECLVPLLWMITAGCNMVHVIAKSSIRINWYRKAVS
jgi:hypothetical protein